MFTELNLSADDKTERLLRFDWLQELNRLQLDTLSQYLKPCAAPAGSVIFQEGEVHPYFCFLCEGKVNVVKVDATDKSKTLATLSGGKVFGEVSFFDPGSTCSASVIAQDDVMLLMMTRKKFEKLCDEVPHIGLQIVLQLIGHLSRRLRQTTGKLVDLL